MAAMFFEICKYPYSLLFPFGQRYCIPNFKLIRPTVYALQFSNLIAPPSGESGQFFLFDQKQCHTHVSWVWWRYLIPFKSYSCLSEIGPASFKLFTPLCKRELKFQLFFDNYWYSLAREHFCGGLVWWAKNLGLVRKSRFWQISRWRKNYLGANEIGDSHFVLIDPRITGI